MGLARVFFILSLLFLATLPLVGRSDPTYPGTQQTIHEDRGIFSAEYIIPNETDAQVLAPLVKERPGVLLSIGSFRGPLVAAMGGEFSHVVSLDYDRAL